MKRKKTTSKSTSTTNWQRTAEVRRRHVRRQDLEILGGGDQITVDQGTGHVFIGDPMRFAPPEGGCCESLEARLWEFAELLPPTMRPSRRRSKRPVMRRSTDGGSGREPRPELPVRIRADHLVRHIRALPNDPGSGATGHGQRERLGIQPNTEYHYRVIVTNEGGTRTGVTKTHDADRQNLS